MWVVAKSDVHALNSNSEGGSFSSKNSTAGDESGEALLQEQEGQTYV